MGRNLTCRRSMPILLRVGRVIREVLRLLCIHSTHTLLGSISIGNLLVCEWYRRTLICTMWKSVLSKAGEVVYKRRNSLNPSIVENVLFLNTNFYVAQAHSLLLTLLSHCDSLKIIVPFIMCYTFDIKYLLDPYVLSCFIPIIIH